MSGPAAAGRMRRLPAAVAGLARTGWPLLAILAVVVAVNAPSLLHLVVTNPLLTRSGLGHVTRPGVVPGQSSLDPNDGFTSLALEHRAALDWVHGHLPLWVGQEGLGAPLLAEGQSAAFSPLCLLTLLPQGLLLQHLGCELIAGWGTYFLGRQLGFGRGIATFAGIVFACNGTFAWLGNAVVNPVCFLPLVLLGIERIHAARRHGAALLAAAVAFSLLAGFPEVAGIDLLFAGVWALARLVGAGDRVRAALRYVAGVLVGALLSAPAWLPFERYVSIAYVGTHTARLSYVHPGVASLSALGLPYAFGDTDENVRPLFTHVVWDDAGGYVTAAVLVLAVVGLGARDAPRLLRVGLGLWVALVLGRTYGFHPAEDLIAHVPEVNRSEFYRYSPPSYELAAAILAGYGARELARARQAARAWRARGLVAVAATGLVLVYLAIRASQHTVFPHGLSAIATAQLAAAVVAVLAAFATTSRWRRVRLPVTALLLLAAAEAVVSFALPQLAAPRTVAYSASPAEFLETHAAGSRVFVVAGGIASNFGAYYGFRLLNVNDLPIPTLWRDTVMTQLQPGDTGYVFPASGHGQPTPAQVLQQREAAFEAAGVGYVVASQAALLPADATVVYRARDVLIGALPDPRPLVSAAVGGPCSASGPEYGTFTVTCSSAATLRVLQLDLPGWSARVQGAATAVRSDPSGPYQLVTVPAGRSTVVMSYWAPGLSGGLALAGVGAVGGLLLWNVAGLRRRVGRRRPRATGRPAGDGDHIPAG